jgi:hypothetical protein
MTAIKNDPKFKRIIRLRDDLIQLQNFSIELGRLQSAQDAIGYTVFLNEKGDTLQGRIDLLKSKIDNLKECILSEAK